MSNVHAGEASRHVQQLRAAGLTDNHIAFLAGCSRTTIRYIAGADDRDGARPPGQRYTRSRIAEAILNIDTNNPRSVDATPPPDTPRRWWDHAACNGHPNPDWWFAEDLTRDGKPLVAQAKAVCATCPVAAACLHAGLHEPYGIWGGQTVNERKRLREARRLP